MVGVARHAVRLEAHVWKLGLSLSGRAPVLPAEARVQSPDRAGRNLPETLETHCQSTQEVQY